MVAIFIAVVIVLVSLFVYCLGATSKRAEEESDSTYNAFLNIQVPKKTHLHLVK